MTSPLATLSLIFEVLLPHKQSSGVRACVFFRYHIQAAHLTGLCPLWEELLDPQGLHCCVGGLGPPFGTKGLAEIEVGPRLKNGRGLWEIREQGGLKGRSRQAEVRQ